MVRKTLSGLALATAWTLSVQAQVISLGYIGAEGQLDGHNLKAYEWAKKTYQTKTIAADAITKTDLTQFAVVWWQDGVNDPTALMTGPVADALNKYLSAGGSLLLSAAAEKLANPLGVETGTPRIYGPGADGQKAGLTVREDTAKHPVWNGLGLKAGDQYEVTTVGYPKSSDYHSRQFKDAVTIGDCWETGSNWTDQVGAFVEWKKGSGTVFGMGWRLPQWSDDNKSIANLEKMTANVIQYLASNSAFLAVEARGKSAVMWGELKDAR